MSRIYLIIAGMLAVLSATYFVSKIHEHYREQGREEIRKDVAQKSHEALLIRNAEIERVKHEQTEVNRKVVADYENKLKSLSDRLADAKSIGLRVPKSTCDGFTSTTETASASGNNETEYVRLPERIESGLFRIAERAQEINIQLGACQSWIIQNGFYPSAPSSKPNTQD